MSAHELMRCPFCARVDGVSEEDPDSAFSDMLAHIRIRHPEQDQEPSVLWPKIKVTSGA